MSGILLEIEPDVTEVKKKDKTIIKIIGVGGGGCNAVRHMYNKGIKDVDYIVCNTDKQALDDSPIPVKIQLGEGLGAGAVPDVAREAALEKEEEIKAVIEGANMVFVTAGMGGGTGTGASPIVASIAKEMGILTVGIVTFPFDFEKDEKFTSARNGIRELQENVDALLVIKNQSLVSYYPDLKLSNAFAKADDILLIAAKSIAELITSSANINIDFRDVDTILRNSGTAIIGSGRASGENRAMDAVAQAIESPLLDNNSVYGAEKMLLFVSYSSEYEILVSELETITNELDTKTCGMKEKFIWGCGYDESLGADLQVTIIATGLHNSCPDVPINKIHINGEPIQPKEEPTIAEEQDNRPEIKHEYEQKPVDQKITNDTLRSLDQDKMNEYDNSVREAMRERINHRNPDSISDYKTTENGLECQPAYLKHVVD